MTYAMWDTISAKQMEFMRRREKYIAYGGARGGGKSWVARTKAVGMCLRYAGLRVLMVRKTFAQLRENIILPMQEQFATITFPSDDCSFADTQTLCQFVLC